MATTILLLFIAALLLLLSLRPTEAKIGVCYGMKGDNLPCPEEVVDLYEFYGIGAMRLYEPDRRTLNAVKRTKIKVMLGVANEDIISIGCSQSTADKWVDTNVVPYADSIEYITVGNEIRPYHKEASSVEPAMQNIQNALNSCHLGTRIKVSTAIDTSLIINSYPPSSAEYSNITYIAPIIKFLSTYDSPLFANIETYAAYMNDRKNIRLDYVLFTACEPVFTDNKTGKSYQNLFDATYDAVYVATQKVAVNYGNPIQNKGNVRVGPGEGGHPHGRFRNGRSAMVSDVQRMTWHSSWQHNNHHRYDRCGWGSEGGEAATVENAKIFYKNLIKHVKKGTPLTQGQELDVYLFAMFDENLKPGDESERNYGLFTPDGFPHYGFLDFSGHDMY